MLNITIRVFAVVLAFVMGLALNEFVKNSSLVERALMPFVKVVDKNTPPTPIDQPLKLPPGLPTEISFKVVHTWCEGCLDRQIVFRTMGTGEFEEASVTEVDLNTNKVRYGKLDPYHYQKLIHFFQSQGYFEMADGYGMGWIDCTVVTTSVAVGGRLKRIPTGCGHEPLQLWGIHRAVEGVLTHVNWETDK